MMNDWRSRVSLYWLADREFYIGDAACVRPSAGWLPLLSTATEGSLALASEHLFFDTGGPTVVVLPVAKLRDASVQLGEAHITATFTCTGAVQRAVLMPPNCAHTILGVSVPCPQTETWVLRFARAEEWVAELLRSLFTRHRVDELLPRREAALQSAAAGVSFCVRRQVPMREQRGVLHISDAALTFTPLFPMRAHGTVTLARHVCDHTFARRIIFEAVGLDVYTSASVEAPPALSLIFNNERERDEARQLLAERLGVRPYRVSVQAVADAWRRRALSTYEYLLHLNKWASRCVNDVFQHPVFPWVLADYTSAHLDLSDPLTFRDLHKPVGALTGSRLALLQERAGFLREAEEAAYLYSTHYSSAGVVAYYLVRPHPELQLSLQGGILDVAERMMESIPQLWRSVTTNTSNFRELIPQFFNAEFIALHGPPLLPLGTHTDGTTVAAYVELPPWAADAADFVRQHRCALESDVVSSALHAWVDLIFGVAQTGVRACEASNLFHPFSYPQRDKRVSVPGLHLSAHEYAREFGNVPVQVFSDAHPGRTAASQLAVVCTAEVAEACGCASESPDQQRLQRMMTELQLLDEAPNTPAEASEADDAGVDALPARAAALRTASTAALACRAVQLVVLGVAETQAVLLVVGGDRHTATLFDAATGTCIRTFPDFDGSVTAAASYAGDMYVFTEGCSCYAVSLASCAVAYCVANVTAAPVTHACLTPRLTLLADCEARLSGWVHAADATPAPFTVPPDVVCEASSQVKCLGGSAEGDAVAAATDRLELFMCVGAASHECWLHGAPDGAEVLHVLPTDAGARVWVFFGTVATLHDRAGCPLQHITYDRASLVVCPRMGHRPHPLCMHIDGVALSVQQVLRSGDGRLESLPYCRAASPYVAAAENLVACIGAAVDSDPRAPLVLTLVALTAPESAPVKLR